MPKASLKIVTDFIKSKEYKKLIYQMKKTTNSLSGIIFTNFLRKSGSGFYIGLLI